MNNNFLDCLKISLLKWSIVVGLSFGTPATSAAPGLGGGFGFGTASTQSIGFGNFGSTSTATTSTSNFGKNIFD